MHEQSETVQRPDGRWINIYGAATPNAGKPLPGMPEYPTVGAAVTAAKARSAAHNEFEVTAPDGRKFIVTAPPGASQDEALAYAKTQFEDAPTVVPRGGTYDRGDPAPEPYKPPSAGSRLAGAGEAALSVASSIPASALGFMGGIVEAIKNPRKLGTPEGARAMNERRGEITDFYTYQPRTQGGQEGIKSLTDMLAESKLQGLNPAGGPIAARAVPPAARAVVAADREAERLTSLIMRPALADDMRGVGAAATSPEAIRRERAGALPVPIKLTKGQADRTFEQQRFEREAAKGGKEGEPLRQRFADQNERILQNFDAWVDETGAEAPNVRATGQGAVSAITKKATAAKTAIQNAYAAATEAGELAVPVSTRPLVDYLEQHRPEAINAPVLSTIEQKLVQLGGATKGPDGKLVPGSIPINSLEEIRKMIGAVSDSTPTNLRFGAQAKSVIDAATEGAGGELYQKARALRTRYAREFDDQRAINDLIRNKPGSTDRAVAYEDVFAHSILNGSLDDVRSLRRTLQTQGAEGTKAWKEMQGETVKHLKEAATKGVTTDARGNRVISPAALDKAVAALDKDGKLDFIFGKKGAQQIRDVNDLARDVFTAPPGSVNTSNTASVLLGALDLTASAMAGMPLPAATSLKALRDKMKSRQLTKRVNAALSDPIGPPP